jgi:hypothetical protein
MSREHFITHNDAGEEGIDTSWVQLQNTLQATVAQLTAAFGPPLKRSGRSKVHLEWQLQFLDSSEVATIYSWAEPTEPKRDDLIVWRIGSKRSHTALRVHDEFRGAHGLSVRSAA